MPGFRQYQGRIAYLHDRDGETGHERFHVTVGADGLRTVRASCVLDGGALLRDVIYSVDARWRPIEAYVRLARQGRYQGAAWYRFDDAGAECTGHNAAHGSFRQRIAMPCWPTLFAPHPLVCDGWQAAAYDHARGTGLQRLDHCTNSSSEAEGGSGPALEAVWKELEYLGEQRLECAAGAFQAGHYRIHPRMPAMRDWPPLEFWAAGEDRLLLRMRWELLQSSYELVELEGELR